jgi:Glycosyl hydrolase family 81 N-terminal domain
MAYAQSFTDRRQPAVIVDGDLQILRYAHHTSIVSQKLTSAKTSGLDILRHRALSINTKRMPPVEREPVARPVRPQYHFFYGSTEDTDTVDQRTSTSTQTEQESLIGESLVPTDNEEETPSSRKYDLQHVLISSSNGEVRHVMGPGAKNNSLSNTLKIKHPMNGGSHPSNQKEDQTPRDCLSNLRDHHPMVHIVSLVVCMTVCMISLAITLFRNGSQRAATVLGDAGESVPKFVQKFPVVDRSKSTDPAQAFLDMNLFHPDLLHNSKSGSDPFRIFTFPFPTGAFWTNLVLPPTADQGFSYPIAVYPYAYKWSDSVLVASYPALHRNEQPKAIHDYFEPDLTFGVKEDVQKRYVTNFDPLSVALQFLAAKGSWNSYLVQGSPYVTIEYDTVTPTIRALSTFKNVFCPGEASYSGKDDEFDDIFSDDEAEDPASRRRRMLGVCGTSVRTAM